jgi:ubiquinone/menaquinone biosynthesis C-methylase UbiE
MRCLEIGPGKTPIPGFESLNLQKSERTEGNADHVGDARYLPFENNIFDIVYSSHCIEHIQWYQVEDTIKEWARVLKSGGKLEVWTVNGYAIAKALVEYEESDVWSGPPITEWKNKKILSNIDNNPYLWASGRIMSYPRSGDYDSNLHRVIWTPKFLKKCFEKAGLKNIRDMDRSEIRGYDHGWINMGVCGVKL